MNLKLKNISLKSCSCKRMVFLTSPIYIAGVGVFFLFIYILLQCFLLDLIIDYVIYMKSVLKEDSPAVKVWSSPFDVRLKVYLYNITNPEQFESGQEEGVVTEIGPYVYDVTFQRIQKPNKHEIDEITFSEKRQAIFNAELSRPRSDTDLILTIDFIFMTLLKMTESSTGDEKKIIIENIPMLFPNKTSPILKTQVKEILFDGIEVKCNNPNKMAPLICKALRGSNPDFFWRDAQGKNRLAMLKNNNLTSHTTLTLSRGLNSLYDLEQFRFINGFSSNVWSNHYCNMLNGTQGAYWNPGVRKKKDMFYYDKRVCRSFRLEYYEDIVYRGIHGYRYLVATDVFSSPKENPSNTCFCLDESCPPSGLMDILPCASVALYISNPYFTNSNISDFLNKNIIPIKRKDPLHFKKYGSRSYADIEPIIGRPFNLLLRLQTNVHVAPSKTVKFMENIKESILPIFWYEEISAMQGDVFTLFQSYYSTVRVTKQLAIVPLIIGVCLILIAILLAIRSKHLLCWSQRKIDSRTNSSNQGGALEASTAEQHDITTAWQENQKQDNAAPTTRKRVIHDYFSNFF